MGRGSGGREGEREGSCTEGRETEQLQCKRSGMLIIPLPGV